MKTGTKVFSFGRRRNSMKTYADVKAEKDIFVKYLERSGYKYEVTTEDVINVYEYKFKSYERKAGETYKVKITGKN